MLEFVVALSVFILLLAGIFDYSLAIREQAVMVDAARSAARLGSRKAPVGFVLPAMKAGWRTGISNLAQNTVNVFMAGAGYNPADYTTTTTFAEPVPGTPPLATVRVSIARTAPRQSFFALIGNSACFSTSYPLNASLNTSGTPPC